MLNKLNTQFNGDRTIRFESNVIKVYLNIPNIFGNAKEEIEAWEEASENRIHFEYVNSRVSEGIEILPMIYPLFICGSTNIDHGNGIIRKATN